MTLLRRPAVLLSAFFLLAAGAPLQTAALETAASNAGAAVSAGQAAEEVWNKPYYAAYRSGHSKQPAGRDRLTLDAGQLTARSADAALLENYEGKSGRLVRTSDESDVTFGFSVRAAGLYALRLTYFAEQGSGNAVRRALYLDGSLPFREAADAEFDRVFADEGGVHYRLDPQGNQIRANAVEARRWREQDVRDPISGDAYLFYLTAGAHTLRLAPGSESMVIAGIEVCAPEPPGDYADYLRKCEKEYGENRGGDRVITIQAEEIDEKSAASVYGSCDRQTADVQPYALDRMVLNELSGAKFSQPGQWVTYRFYAKEAGYYRLAFKYKQTYKDSGTVNRRIFLDGAVPFAQWQALPFHYADAWESFAAGSDEPQYVYLSKGDHTLTLQAVAGDLTEIIGRARTIADGLGAVYRRLFIMVGPEPDPFRDYDFRKTASGELDDLRENYQKLERLLGDMTAMAGQRGGYLAPVERLMVDIRKMTDDPDSIAQRLANFVVDLGGLSDWTITLQSQPMDLDYIELLQPDAAPAKAGAGFFRNLWHNIRLFLSSFYSSYSSIGGPAGDGDPVTVWLGATGRDQANIIKQMIDERFVPGSGVPVKLQFATGALLPSTLAGIGPDVYLFAASSEPINYALRGAVQELGGMPGFAGVASRFPKEAMVPYTYRGGTYAVPETVTYPMLFYRRDIFAELGLEPPATWDEAYDVILKLQGKNLSFGMTSTPETYYMFLRQMDQAVYRDGGRAVTFDSKTGVAAFNVFTKFFSSYKLKVAYSFINRFRTGEMPAGIADFTAANQLFVSAPELRGMWGMAPLPGMVKEDGAVDNSAVLEGTADIIMKQSENPAAAWKFLDWWSTADTQSDYARGLENAMGLAARYPTANAEAFSRQAWSKADMAALRAQKEKAVGVPEVPGSYILARYVSFAFSAVVDEGAQPGKEILRYTKSINTELARKQREFQRKTEGERPS